MPILVKQALMLMLGLWGILGAFEKVPFYFLQGANLLFHEAGHIFFAFFGMTIMAWGGTLLQLLIPLGIGVGFLKQRQPTSACVMLWWCGQNGIGIARYIKDARAQVLPTVGGEIHDWNFILGKMQLLEYDQVIGNAVWLGAVMTMLSAVALGVWAVERFRPDEKKESS